MLPLVFVLCFIMAVVVGGACYCKTKLKKAGMNDITSLRIDPVCISNVPSVLKIF